jgi:hypothetical protein
MRHSARPGDAGRYAIMNDPSNPTPPEVPEMLEGIGPSTPPEAFRQVYDFASAIAADRDVLARAMHVAAAIDESMLHDLRSVLGHMASHAPHDRERDLALRYSGAIMKSRKA